MLRSPTGPSIDVREHWEIHGSNHHRCNTCHKWLYMSYLVCEEHSNFTPSEFWLDSILMSRVLLRLALSSAAQPWVQFVAVDAHINVQETVAISSIKHLKADDEKALPVLIHWRADSTARESSEGNTISILWERGFWVFLEPPTALR